MVGKEAEQNSEQCSHQTNTRIPLQNRVTLQRCVQCVEGIIRNVHREGCGRGAVLTTLCVGSRGYRAILAALCPEKWPLRQICACAGISRAPEEFALPPLFSLKHCLRPTLHILSGPSTKPCKYYPGRTSPLTQCTLTEVPVCSS